jgi:hypothetical protein
MPEYRHAAAANGASLAFAGRIEEAMVRRQSKSQPTWTDVKSKLAGFDRTGLLALVQDLYAAHKDNQAFLHARLGLGEDVLEPYKQTLDRWCFGLTYCGGRTLRLPKPNKPFPVTGRRLAIPLGWRS